MLADYNIFNLLNNANRYLLVVYDKFSNASVMEFLCFSLNLCNHVAAAVII